MWRLTDPKHPEYDATLAAQNGPRSKNSMSRSIRCSAKFSEARRPHDSARALRPRIRALQSFVQSEYLVAEQRLHPSKAGPAAGFERAIRQRRLEADSRLRHRLNGLYLNLRGRERTASWIRRGGRRVCIHEIQDKNARETRSAERTASDHARRPGQRGVSGSLCAIGPDMLVGYNRGYRAGWKTILGAFPPDVLEDNTNPWSGDHCMDYTLVPGVLLSNRKIAALLPR